MPDPDFLKHIIWFVTSAIEDFVHKLADIFAAQHECPRLFCFYSYLAIAYYDVLNRPKFRNVNFLVNPTSLSWRWFVHKVQVLADIQLIFALDRCRNVIRTPAELEIVLIGWVRTRHENCDQRSCYDVFQLAA